MTPQLQQLLQQRDALLGMGKPVEPNVQNGLQQIPGVMPNPVYAEPYKEEDIRNLIKELLAQELKSALGVSPTNNAVEKVEQSAEAPKAMTLMDAVNHVLSPADKEWLFNVERAKAIDGHLVNFILTESGKDAINSFLKFFKGNYGQ